MNMRLFFLQKDGWFEAELTEKLLHASGEDLIRWAYAMMERHHYRNYLITEVPIPCLPESMSCPLCRPERGKGFEARKNS
jgi:hypothetical protein